MSANRDSNVVLVLGGVGFVLVLLCGGSMALFQRWLNRPPTAAEAAFNAEFDGKRPLIANYDLWMLKGFPRAIMEDFDHSLSSRSDQIHIPPTVDQRESQVGKFAIFEGFIIGHIAPYTGVRATTHVPGTPVRNFFVLDTSKHEVAYFSDRAEWSAACAKGGFDVDHATWRLPDPGK